jgi:vitamin B12 transporter
MRIFSTISVLLGAAASQTALAEEAGLIVVTAARGETPVSEVGQSVSVIELGEIERRQSVSVIDLLSTVPGVSFASNGGIGTPTTVYIRGAESDQTLALIDGVKLNDPSTPGGGFNFGNLMTYNVERIEVVRGSQSVLWGSQAIGGVVNVITRAPGEELAIDARGEYGANESAELVGNVSGTFGPVAASVGGGYYTTDGISRFAEGTEVDGYRNYGANAKVTVTLSDAVSVDLRGWYSDGKVDFDGYPCCTFAFADTDEYGTTEEFIGYAGFNFALLGGRFTNRIAAAYTDTARDNFDRDSTPSKTFDSSGRNTRFEYQGNFLIAGSWKTTFGAESEESRYRTVSFGSENKADARLDSVYAQLSGSPFAGLTTTAGVRYDDHDEFGSNTSFAANAVYTPNDGRTTIRASYGEGFKAPSLFQLYSDYGNTLLQPETSESWDAGITQTLLGGAVEIGATFFHRDTANQIDFVSCFGALSPICVGRPFGTYDNVRKSRAQGVELGLAVNPTEALQLAANYTYLDAEDRITGRTLPRRPSETMNALVDYSWPFKLKTGFTVSVVGDRYDDVANARRVEGYALVDIRASYPITDKVELYGRVENLFDAGYETLSDYGTLGRSAYAGVRVRY